MEDKNNRNNINWYPGHMQKAKVMMQDTLKLVDIVVELRDARIPESSLNPMLNDIIGNKQRLIVLTKKDMADKNITEKWLNYYKSLGYNVLAIDANKDNLNKLLPDVIKTILKDKLERAKARGIRKKVLRAMVVGIPNVGKSTLINGIVKKRVAKVENRPGVTKSLQWIKINEDVELLDTPGVLWPRFKDRDVAIKLALLGSLNDRVTDKRELVLYAIDHLKVYYQDVLTSRYKVVEFNDSMDILKQIAANLNFLKSEGEYDLDKAIDFILSDIRNNRIANVSWDMVNE